MKFQSGGAKEGKVAGRVEISEGEGEGVGGGDVSIAEIAGEAASVAGDVRREDEGERRLD